MLTAAMITRALHQKAYPGVDIRTSKHPVLPGQWIITVPPRVASDLSLTGMLASREKGSGYLTRWLGEPVWVADIEEIPSSRRNWGGARYRISIRQDKATMKFWKNNRADQPFEMELTELADLYLASVYATWEWPLDRSLPGFLGDPDGPVSAVWDDQAAYTTLKHLIAGRAK